MEKVISLNIMNGNSVLSNGVIECRALYLSQFNLIPSIAYVEGVNDMKALEAFVDKYGELISSYFDYKTFKREGEELKEWGIILKNECIVESTSWSILVLYNVWNEEFAMELVDFFCQFRWKEKRKPREINLVVRESYGLQLKPMEIKRSKLDLDLFYENDFREMDEIIRKRLNRKNDKGIVLLHGLPGTGKTTYLRYLIGKLKKRVLFLSSSVAGNLAEPQLIDLLISNRNSVVIVEDAENIMMDRKTNANSPVSNLLNISDGLLADILNIQLVCTFNSPLVMVDPALMRKGRLIARYEFGKLSVEKAQRLSNHFGFDKLINKPMTLAEITNPYDKDEASTEVIGFRRQNACLPAERN